MGVWNSKEQPKWGDNIALLALDDINKHDVFFDEKSSSYRKKIKSAADFSMPDQIDVGNKLIERAFSEPKLLKFVRLAGDIVSTRGSR